MHVRLNPPDSLKWLEFCKPFAQIRLRKKILLRISQHVVQCSPCGLAWGRGMKLVLHVRLLETEAKLSERGY